MKLTEARDGRDPRAPDPPFHNVPEILLRLRGKVASASKLFKSVASDKLRLELEHAMLSVVNYLALLEDEAAVIVRKNAELEARACEGERLYRDYLEKCAGQQKDLQRDLSLLQARCGKLGKQNEYLSFVNRGLKNQLDEKRRYIAGYRDTHCREVRRMMKTIEQEARAGADRVFDRINQVVEMCDRELQHSPNTEGEEPQDRPPDPDCPSKDRPDSHASATLKKRSHSACQATTARKKNIESKLARIVFEQAKLADRNERYL